MNALAFINCAAAVIVLAHTAGAINAMTPQTNHVIRIALIILCFGEFSLVAGYFFGQPYLMVFEIALINCSVAVLCIFDRRRPTLTAVVEGKQP